MIGGVNPNSNLAYQPGSNAPARERRDLVEVSPPAAESRQRKPSDSLERRVESRRAAEDIRLERFRADDLPLNTSRALATFANVAAPAEAPEGVLTGIDIRV